MKNPITEAILDKITADMRFASEAIDRIREKGYTETFTLIAGKLICTATGQQFTIHDFRVEEIYRFNDTTGLLTDYYIYVLHEHGGEVRGIFAADLTGNTTRPFI